MNQDLRKCTKHKKDFSLFCRSDNELICLQCKPQHTSHNLIDKIGSESLILQEIQTMIPSLKSQLSEISGMSFPNSMNSDYDSNMKKIKEAQFQLKKVIDNYFEKLIKNFENLFSCYPSQDSKKIIEQKISKNLTEIEELETKIKSNLSNFSDIENFFVTKFECIENEISSQINRLKEHINIPNPQKLIPKININESSLEKIHYNLNKYISTILPGEISQDKINNLVIKMENYFLSKDEKVMVVINDNYKSIGLTHLDMNKSVRCILNTDKEIPYGHSLIITPYSSIFLCGGILNSGLISGSTFKFNPSNLGLEPKCDMIVKKIGHSLAYLEQEGGGKSIMI